MRRFHLVCGVASLVAIAAGLNLLAFKQDPFVPSVFLPLVFGMVAGAVWLVLGLTGMAKSSVQEGRIMYGLNTVLASSLFLGICMVVYAFAQHGNRSWDLTREGRRQLSTQTIQVLQNLDKDVDIICFFLRIDDELVRIASDKTTRFLDQCQQCTGRLKVEYLDPQVEESQLRALGITHASTQGTVVIRCANRQKVITLQGANPRLEERDFTNSLINVIRDTQPKVCFLTGHGERNTDDQDDQKGGSMLKGLLEGESYAVERTAIMISHPEVQADCDVLVVNGLGVTGPQSDLRPEEIHALQAFLDKGGRLLVMIDPWRRVNPAAGQADQLLPWLEQRYGVAVGNDMAISPTNRWLVEFAGDKSPFNENDPNNPFRGCFNASHSITQNFDRQIIFKAARSVGLVAKSPSSVAGTELLRTTPDYYGEEDLALLAQGKATQSPGERQGPLSMAVAVTAKTEMLVGDSGQTRDARVVVVGDSDFASNGQITIPGNLNFVLNIMAWLTENEELIAIRPTGKQDPPVILSDFDQRAIVWIAVLGTVQAVVAAGLIVFALRRKYQ